MNRDHFQVRGLRNLGNTCFLNCILQALAPSGHLKSYLRQAVCAYGPNAPDIAVALLESLEDLAPIPNACSCPPVSPGALLSVLREHVRADVLTDGEQNDAVEALEVLLGTIVSELQSAFLHGRGPELTSLSAWHDISKGAVHPALYSPSPVTQLEAVKSAPCTDAVEGSDSQQERCHKAALDADAQRLVSLRLSVAEDDLTATATLTISALDTRSGAVTIGTADGQSQTGAIQLADENSKTSATAGAGSVSCNMAPQHAPEQVHAPPGDPMLQAWRALSGMPLEMALQHEAACARCRRPCASHVSAMLALPITLPTVEGSWGLVLKRGTTLHHALAAYFARDLVQDATCTHCSLRATLEQAPPAMKNCTGSQPSPGPRTHANGPSKTMDNSLATATSASQAAVHEDVDACPCIPARGGDRCSGEGVSRGGGGVEGAAEKLARLRGLLRGSCAPPDCDYVQLAAEAGLTWCERRAPLLTRAVLARPPQVLCLQLRRVLWTRRGRLAKVPGRVAFPEELDLAPYSAAAAEPLLPVARPIVSHPLASLSQSHRAPDLAHPSMRSRGVQDLIAAEPTAAPPQIGRCSYARCSEGTSSAMQERGEQSCRCSSGVDSADGRGLASAAGKVDEQQQGAAVRHRWKPERGAAMLYRLAAVIMHHGGAQSGHYTVYRKASVDEGDSYGHAEAAPREEHQSVDRALDNSFMIQVNFGDRALGSDACRLNGKSNWVHASDEDVRTAALAEVLSSEAAVLLYERALQ